MVYRGLSCRNAAVGQAIVRQERLKAQCESRKKRQGSECSGIELQGEACREKKALFCIRGRRPRVNLLIQTRRVLPRELPPADVQVLLFDVQEFSGNDPDGLPSRTGVGAPAADEQSQLCARLRICPDDDRGWLLLEACSESEKTAAIRPNHDRMGHLGADQAGRIAIEPQKRGRSSNRTGGCNGGTKQAVLGIHDKPYP